MLQPKAATHLALILHEHGTNARKYGALATPHGHVSLRWDVAESEGRRSLHLIWRETGGPAVGKPTNKGFGTTLIEQTLRSLGGSVAFNFADAGLVCEIYLPLLSEIRVAFGGDTLSTSHAIAPSQAAEASTRPTLANKRILIVEDEAMVAMEIEATLEEAGCKIVGPVATVELVRVLIENTKFDAALLDGNLAGRSVDELADQLIQIGIPFAFVTGYGRESLPENFRDWPMLAKPFAPIQLQALVGQLLHEKRVPAFEPKVPNPRR